MALQTYAWAARDEFLNRTEDLARLDRWWRGRDRTAVAPYGRRRVGKSWLLRAFADGKPGLVLVADQGAECRQLDRFADGPAPPPRARPCAGGESGSVVRRYRLSRPGSRKSATPRG